MDGCCLEMTTGEKLSAFILRNYAFCQLYGFCFVCCLANNFTQSEGLYAKIMQNQTVKSWLNNIERLRLNRNGSQWILWIKYHRYWEIYFSFIVYHAAAKEVKLNSVESRLEGDIDLRGFLGLSKDVLRGYKGIRMYFKIDADVPDEKLEEIVQFGPTYSPVFDTITRAVPVSGKPEK